ncbi:sugar phosphate isomerase/epimerase family protein [Scatolibacter rhodanostii]|uniref:sugar phosphate isomerase/epimerase family protein n=1 Tax=Scatolibacter rhodanostii TaxID=2014781 RepID=UPI000C07FFC5|nr:sugar phosphate isomerase/epimerase [Scatolibacter rhodanostii]
MKLGVLTNVIGEKPLKEALTYFKSLGMQMVELGCGGYPGKDHCNPDILLHDEVAYNEFMETLKESGLGVSALSCHANPIHPNKEIAAEFDRDLHNAVLMAEKMGIDRINTFSGCPGDSPTSQYPNWVTCAWPEDFAAILDYQWNDVLIPYWKNFVAFAKEHGVNKIGFEMHQGFCVYNTYTMKKIRDAVGPELGANLDPSHLFWQGMDPLKVIRELGGDAIFHVHAKDTKIDPVNAPVNGLLDIQSYADEANRSWVFRSIGYGHDELFWKDFVSTLRLVGYDYVMSIEHEDSFMSKNEGLVKAVDMLKRSITFEDKMTDLRWV